MPRPPRIAPHPAVLARREAERLAIVAQRSAERTETKAFGLIIRNLIPLSPASRRKVIEEIALLDMDLLDPKAQDETPEAPANESQKEPANPGRSDVDALAFLAGGPNPLLGKEPVNTPTVVRDDLPEDVTKLFAALKECKSEEEIKALGAKDLLPIRNAKANKAHYDLIGDVYRAALARFQKAA